MQANTPDGKCYRLAGSAVKSLNKFSYLSKINKLIKNEKK